MSKVILSLPSEAHRESYISALLETLNAEPETAQRILQGRSVDAFESDFGGFIAGKLADQRQRTPGRVPYIEFWGMVDGEYAGRISIRLELNGQLRSIGGHIGYDVRPSRRRGGIATEMLRQALDKAHALGLSRVLLTCNETNHASRRVIEKCGGVSIASSTPDDGEKKLRYWITTKPHAPGVSKGIAQSVEFLALPSARESIVRNPYWPKWNSPWWHAVALGEIGCAHLIPRETLECFAHAFAHHYIRHFPLRESEIPEGADPYRTILCHCALGCMGSLLHSEEISLPNFAPWLVEWLDRYQLPDGGFNCDEAVYTKERPVSSFVSTAPMLELALGLTDTGHADLSHVLDRGIRYLTERRFVHSIRTGKLVSERWLEPLFPRFYEYDLLRGLAIAAEWADRRGMESEQQVCATEAQRIAHWFTGDDANGDTPIARAHGGEWSLRPQGASPNSTWEPGKADRFPLLEALSKRRYATSYLRTSWNRLQWLFGNGEALHSVP